MYAYLVLFLRYCWPKSHFTSLQRQLNQDSLASGHIYYLPMQVPTYEYNRQVYMYLLTRKCVSHTSYMDLKQFLHIITLLFLYVFLKINLMHFLHGQDLECEQVPLKTQVSQRRRGFSEQSVKTRFQNLRNPRIPNFADLDLGSGTCFRFQHHVVE